MKPIITKAILTIITLIVVSCSPSDRGNERTNTATVIQDTAEQSKTLSMPVMLTGTPTLKQLSLTPSPSVINTITMTATPRLSPLPTFTEKQLKLKLAELMSFDQNCPFPCWGGITPGMTFFNDARQIMRQFGKSIKIDNQDIWGRIFEGDQSSPESLLVPFIDFYMSSDRILITDINIDIFDIDKYYLPHEIIRNYGKPEILLVQPYFYPDGVALFVALAYPSKGIYIRYDLRTVRIGTATRGCWKNLDCIDIFLTRPGAPPPENYQLYTPHIGHPILSFEEAVKMTIDEFIQESEKKLSYLCIDVWDSVWIIWKK